jgi:hypothetical protein
VGEDGVGVDLSTIRAFLNVDSESLEIDCLNGSQMIAATQLRLLRSKAVSVNRPLILSANPSLIDASR